MRRATDRCLFISASHAAWVWRKIVLSRIGRDVIAATTRVPALHDRPAFDNPRRVCAQRPRRAVKTIYARTFFVPRMARHKASQLRKSAALNSAQLAETPVAANAWLKIFFAQPSRDGSPIPREKLRDFYGERIADPAVNRS